MLGSLSSSSLLHTLHYVFNRHNYTPSSRLLVHKEPDGLLLSRPGPGEQGTGHPAA